MRPSRVKATTTASLLSAPGASRGFFAFGRFTVIPLCSSGVVIMKMMSSTSMMSAIGVTLMSAFTLLLPRPRLATELPSLLEEVVDQLRRGVVHLDREGLDLVGEAVDRHDGGHGHEQPERRRDESLGDPAGDGRNSRRLLGLHPLERVDDPDGRAEEADEGSDRADRRQAAQASLEVLDADGDGAVERALGRLDG